MCRLRFSLPRIGSSRFWGFRALYFERYAKRLERNLLPSFLGYMRLVLRGLAHAALSM